MAEDLAARVERLEKAHLDLQEKHAKLCDDISQMMEMPSLFKDAHKYMSQCNQCQKTGNISRKHEMPLNSVLVCDIFDV